MVTPPPPVGGPPPSGPTPPPAAPPAGSPDTLTAAQQEELFDLFRGTNVPDLLLPGVPLTESAFFELITRVIRLLREALHEAEEQRALLTEKYHIATGIETTRLLNRYSTLRDIFEIQTPTLTAINQAIETQNAEGEDLRVAIDEYNLAVAEYNDAVNAYNSALNEFLSGDISEAQYNNAVAAYNAAVNTYNVKAGILNAKINAYNATVAAYNASIVGFNAELGSLNELRTAAGLPPLPLLDPLPTQSLVPTVSTIAPQPGGPLDPISPLPEKDRNDVPTVASYDIPGFGEGFLLPIFTPILTALLQFLFLQNLTLERINDPTLFNVLLRRDIVKPEAFVEFDPETRSGLTSPYGASLTSLIAGLSSNALERILAQNLLEEVFQNLQLESTPREIARLQLLIITLLINNGLLGIQPGLRGLVDQLAQLNRDSPVFDIALLLGLAEEIRNLLTSPATDDIINQFITDTPRLSELSTEELADFIAQLRALLQFLLSLLLAAQLGQVVDAKLVTKILGALVRLGELGEGLETLGIPGEDVDFSIFQQLDDTTAALLVPLFVTTLQEQGLKRETAERLARELVEALQKAELGRSFDEVRVALLNFVRERLGPEVDVEKIVSALFPPLTTFALALEFRTTLLESIGPVAGNKIAEQTANQLTQLLLGVTLGEEAVEKKAALFEILLEAIKTFKETDEEKRKELILELFRNFHEENEDLGEFFRRLIDPGKIFVGLIYDKSDPLDFTEENKEIDIRV